MNKKKHANNSDNKKSKNRSISMKSSYIDSFPSYKIFKGTQNKLSLKIPKISNTFFNLNKYNKISYRLEKIEKDMAAMKKILLVLNKK